MTLPYQDPRRTVAERVADLLPRMTTAEKAAQCSARYWGRTPDGRWAEVPDALMAEQIPFGIGQICQTGKRRSRAEAAALANRIQRFCRERTRLGIPAICHEETLHGMIANGVTCLPAPVTMAASFAPDLVEAGFAAVGDEAVRAGIRQGLSPVLDLARDPRWGRSAETFGEDPVLAAAMGTAAVRGLQGPPEEPLRLAATGKHFVGYSMGEGGHNAGPTALSRFDLCHVHLLPWRAAIRDGGLAAVMPSYAAVDGVPCHGNPWVLRHLLRDRLGFAGITVADYGGVAEIADLHAAAGDPAECAALALEAGLDVELPHGECYDAALVRIAEADPAQMVRLDEAVARILALKFRLGLFDQPFVDEAAAAAPAAGGDAVALRLAEESAVLLANPTGMLPLDPARLRRVAVVGPHAHENLLGPYYGSPVESVDYVTGLRRVLGPGTTVVHAPGCRITGEPIAAAGELNHRDPDKDHRTARLSTPADDAATIAAAVALTRGCDLTVLVVGDDFMTSGESFRAAPKGDRADLALPGSQGALLAALRAAGVPLVVVLAHMGVIADPALAATDLTVLDMGCPGQAAGLATARILVGLAEPGGRLPVTVPRSAGHLPATGDHAQAARRGYGLDPNRPLFPFGFGLSYTTWEVRDVRLDRERIALGEPAMVRATVVNTGAQAGSEVVQVYHRDRVAARTRAVRELAGFTKVRLPPGGAVEIAIPVTLDRLGYLDEDALPRQEPGLHDLWVATGADPRGGIPLTLAVG